MKPRSWRPWIFGCLMLVLGCAGLLVWAIHQFGWDWTGFTAYAPPTPQYQRGKTLWDWLQLLIVPAILAAGAGFFTWWSARTERYIVQDKQREDLLQSYLDRMTELLLEKGLRNSQTEAEVRKVARTRTVSTLIQVDGRRARTIFVFLREAKLTKKPEPIISFALADLSGAKWSKSDLTQFDLSRAILKGVELNKAMLVKTDFSGAILSHADLNEAYLERANLSGTHSSYANLSKANLNKANLSTAFLEYANLRRADLSKVDLSKSFLFRANLSGANLSGANLSGANLWAVNFSGANFSGVNLSDAKLDGVNLSRARLLESANFDKTILRDVTGLTPEQVAHCKAGGAIFDKEARMVEPLASLPQDIAAIFYQEGILDALPSPTQTIPSTLVQEATSEAASSQEHNITVEKETPPLTPSSQDHTTPLLSSQRDTPSVPPVQGNTTPSSPSQDAAS